MNDGSRFDPRRILERLQHHGVRCLVIGGVAGRLHGSPRMTRDLDVLYARDPEDLRRLAAALAEMRVTLRGAPPDLAFKPDERALRNGSNFTFTTQWGPFDCLGDASGYTYDVLVANAEPMRFEGLDVMVVSLDDLIRMKRASGRLVDLADVETLGKLRDVREELGLYGLAEPIAPQPSRGRAAPARSRSSSSASGRGRSSRRRRESARSARSRPPV